MKKIFKISLFLSIFLIFFNSNGAPIPSSNGGTNAANSNAYQMHFTSNVNLPADINLQTAYNNLNSITLAVGGLQILDPSAVEQFNIFTEEGQDYSIFTGDLQSACNTGEIAPNNAFFQVNCTTQGSIPAPLMTSTQEDALVSPPQGSQVYNSTLNTLDYFDNTAEKHTLLAIDKIIQGANMVVTPNGDGSVTLASTGGSGSTTQVQGTFTTASTSTTSVTTTDSPINIASPLYFNVINAVGTNVTSSTISGVMTPVIQNTSAGGRWGIARFDLTMSFTTLATPTTFAFTVYTNNGASTFFKNVTLPPQSSSNQEIGFASPLIYLNTGDYMYLTVSVASGSAAFTTRNFEGSWVDTTVASIPTTDALAQGASNLYLSDNGGATYQYLTGSSVSNDVPVFTGTGGGLIDSGLAKTTILTTSSPAGGDLTGTLLNLILGTVNSNVGSFGDATHTVTFTLDGKGRTTAASTNLITPAGIGAPQTNGTGATGTWGVDISGNAATVTTNANLTGDVTSSGNSSTLVSSGISKVIAITQVSGTSQALADTAPTNRYFLINSSLATLTLPASPTVGHTFEIVEAGNASWTLAQNSGQSIVTSVNGNSVSTTPGTSGHADGATDRDCITLMYVGSGEFIIESEQTSGTGVVLN